MKFQKDPIMEFTVYKKTEEIDEKLSRGAKKKKGKGSKEASPAVESVPNTNTSGSSSKTKFVSLYTEDGKAAESVQLPGRHSCDCQSLKHALINNCLSCGKIVCVQVNRGFSWKTPG